MDKKKSVHTSSAMSGQTGSISLGGAEVLERDPPLIMRLGQRILKELWAEKTVTKTLTKPRMRGLLNVQIKRNLIFAFLVAGASGLAFQMLVAIPRKKAYAEYYRTLDPEKQFNEMRRRGVFQSC